MPNVTDVTVLRTDDKNALVSTTAEERGGANEGYLQVKHHSSKSRTNPRVSKREARK